MLTDYRVELFGSTDRVSVTHLHTHGNMQGQEQTIMRYHKTAAKQYLNTNKLVIYQDVFIHQVLTNLVTLRLVTLLQLKTKLVTLHLETQLQLVN